MLNRAVLGIAATILLWGLLSCGGSDIDNKESVRAAVIAHIESRGDLRPDELEITVEEAEFSGDTCTARVGFIPKGSNMTSGMTMNYTLVREGDAWRVQPRVPSGGTMQSPQAPLAGAAPSTGGTLPAGHPPISPDSSQRD